MAFVSFAKARRDPRVRRRISERLFKDRVFREVRLTPSWARRAVGAAVAGDLNTQVDVPLAIAANFVAA
jgi:hypothetical protein